MELLKMVLLDIRVISLYIIMSPETNFSTYIAKP